MNRGLLEGLSRPWGNIPVLVNEAHADVDVRSDNWQSFPPYGHAANIALLNNTAYFTPVPIARPCVIDAIAFNVVVLGASSSVQSALYLSAQGVSVPGQLIGRFGDVDTSTTGIKVSSGAQMQLRPGLYWAMLHSGSATPATLTSANYYNEHGLKQSGNSNPASGYALTVTANEVPAIIDYQQLAAAGQIYRVMLRLATSTPGPRGV